MNEVIDQIKQGAEIIGSTFGPAGKNVLFQSRETLPAVLIRDGVKTAQRLAACEPLNTGFKLLTDACLSTVRKAGDGTTTTAILVKAMLENWSEVDIEKYMVTGKVATKEQFYQAAGISGNGREEAKLVADLVWALGPHAHIQPYAALGEKTRIEIKDGYVTPGGMFTAEMMNRYQGDSVSYTHNSAVLKNPLVMLVHDQIHGDQQMISIIMKYVEMKTERPLVIFGTDVNKNAVKAVLDNQIPRKNNQGQLVHNGLPIFLAAGWRDAYSFDDIKKITGANVFSQMGKHLFPVKGCTLTPEDLGSAEEIEITASFHGQPGYSRVKVKDMEIIDKMIDDLKKSITPENEAEVNERISKLAKGIGFIYIGGMTETEHKLIADSVEDCVISLTTVLKYGVVPGSAYSFYELAHRAMMNDEMKFSEVLYEVRKQLMNSMGAKEDGSVFNYRTKEYQNPDECDIWESASVVNESIKSAYSFVHEIMNTHVCF
jgi:chaperonin GroEL